MSADKHDRDDLPDDRAALRLKKLNVEQIRKIDEMLASMGESGEVQLVVQHGELRFINKKTKYLIGVFNAGKDR